MDHEIINKILTAMIGGVIISLSSVAWFLLKRWVLHVDALTQSMADLKGALTELKSEFVTVSQHNRDMEEVRIAQESLRSIGRRSYDRCPDKHCPVRDEIGRHIGGGYR